MTAFRSALFFVWFAFVTVAMHLAALPLLLASRQAVMHAARLWSRLVLWGAKVFIGLSFEVRGEENIPPGASLVASKHQSMWETLALVLLLRDPAIVIKRELATLPFYGWFARRAEMIPIDREGGPAALRALRKAAQRALSERRQLVIFPEGTRRRPGAPPDYKPGVAALYAIAHAPCVPVAHNSGLFWTKFLKHPGTITLEFLPPIPAGLPRDRFMTALQETIEGASNRLLVKTGRRVTNEQ